ncbi:tetratricopeptide repeat protein [Chitinimonas taiwanensis]|uniref:tetratricopeptide repeat protein n=1 Tax=Chitinimonas taiwanensis TaxID=240412 RepID=UPI0035B1785B
MHAPDAHLASATWLYLGGPSGALHCLARRDNVSPLWCLLLAGAAEVAAITTPEPDTQLPRRGLRVGALRALHNWRLFCDFIAVHPQYHRVPALSIYLSAVAEWIEQLAAEVGQSLDALWLQGDWDALSGPFDEHESSRIAFWRWSADSRLALVQGGDPLQLHEITQVVDFESLQDWVRGFGLNSLEHPYFHSLAQEEAFEAQGTPFADFQQAEALPFDPWCEHNFRPREQAGLFGLVDDDGAWHEPPQWQEIRPDAGSLVRVWVRRDALWGLLQIEPTAELLFAPQFDAVVDSAAGELCVASLNGRQGLLDIALRHWRLPPEHEELRRECSGLLRVRQGERLGYLDEDGQVLCAPRYQQTRPFGGSQLFEAQGVAWVVEAGRWGLIDTGCRELQPCQFERVEFREEHDQRGWRVWRDGHQGWVNAAGVLVVPCQWDEVDCFEPYQHACAAEGIYRVQRAGRHGLLPSRGDWCIPCEYEDIEPLGVGPGAPPLPEDALRQAAEPEQGDLAVYIADGDTGQSRLLIRVRNAQGEGVIDEAGRQIVPPAAWRIAAIGNQNLRWLRLEDEQSHYQLWCVERCAPALPGWHAGVDVLDLPGQTLLLSFAESAPRDSDCSLEFWTTEGVPALAGRFIGLLGEVLYDCRLRNDQRELLLTHWRRGEPVEACEILADGGTRAVFIQPGQAPLVANEEWQRRYRQGDLNAALALSRHCETRAQAYQWARRACGLDELAGQASAATWLQLIELSLQGAGDLYEARDWVERGLAAMPELDERARLWLCAGRLWLNPAAGRVDAERAHQALECVQRFSDQQDAEHIESRYYLGHYWYEGLGGTVDRNQARELWRSAAADGHAPACEALLRLLIDDAHAQVNSDAAGQCLEEALYHARQFLAHPQHGVASTTLMAIRYQLGELLLVCEPVAWEEAEKVLHQAAEAGHAQAMGLLAEKIYRDRASPLKRAGAATHWAWRYAAAQGLLATADKGWRRWLFALVWWLRG